jgi:hypothetical protein
VGVLPKVLHHGAELLHHLGLKAQHALDPV